MFHENHIWVLLTQCLFIMRRCSSRSACLSCGRCSLRSVPYASKGKALRNTKDKTFGSLLRTCWKTFSKLLNASWEAFWEAFWKHFRDLLGIFIKITPQARGGTEEKTFGNLLGTNWEAFWEYFGVLLGTFWKSGAYSEENAL